MTALFGVLIFVAVYTTACPLLWTAVSRTGQEGTKKYRLWAIGLAAIGFFFGMFVPYHMMLNYVYGLNGYVGFIVMALVAYRLLKDRFAPSPKVAQREESEA